MPSLIGDKPAFSPRRVRVVCIGAGFSGLMLAHRIRTDPANAFVDLTILEKNSGIGGTWFENRYPGAACDIPAHIYAFPFAPNPNWSRFYSSAGEILQYIKDTAAKFELNDYVQLNARVVQTVWSGEQGKWTITYEQKHPSSGQVEGLSIEAEVLINATGVLNRRKLPNIPGLDKFAGTLVHTAAWDENIDCTGKRVGVIGNGSSAIQVVSSLQSKAAHLFEYIRSPTYITPEYLAEFTPDGTNFYYSDEQKSKWMENPEELRDLRRKMEHALNAYFPVFKQDSPQQAYVQEAFSQAMKARLGGDEQLISKLVPDYPIGCRRTTPGHGYLEALQEDNVTPRFGPITRISEKGVVLSQDGVEIEDELDVLVCATGFDVSFSPRWPILGRNGVNLADLWSENPEAYLSVFAPSMPNYLMFNGPNTPIGHGSYLGAMEATTSVVVSVITKLATQGYKSICVKDEVVREYNEYGQEWLKDSVWAGGCNSWYKRASDNRVTAMYAGSVLHYRQLLENIRFEDFDYEVLGSSEHGEKSNRFQFLGSGISQTEADQGLLGDYLQM